jgi:hypothetical protein
MLSQILPKQKPPETALAVAKRVKSVGLLHSLPHFCGKTQEISLLSFCQAIKYPKIF